MPFMTVVETISGKLRAPHMDGFRIREYFLRLRRVGVAEVLEMI